MKHFQDDEPYDSMKEYEFSIQKKSDDDDYIRRVRDDD